MIKWLNLRHKAHNCIFGICKLIISISQTWAYMHSKKNFVGRHLISTLCQIYRLIKYSTLPQMTHSKLK